MCYAVPMGSGEFTGFYVLCAYGVPPSLSVELMTAYGDEDLIPLNEFDRSEAQYVENL